MEEEVGVKVTRLRRRLSVEAEDTKSPAAPATPTKKRGGRLATKPQLELIDENATEAVPKRTRKSTIKEIIEPVDEKTMTPSRRSTRIRSNTSILSETQTGETVDEKPMTPARRSVRIRSNTSLVSETTQNCDSPRAKRAARRTSQVGSDTEAPITPARQTRRTRKDSASSVDKAEINAVKVGSPIKEVITEDIEVHVKETNNNNTLSSDSPSLRKSPRLIEKGPRKSSTSNNDNKENEPQSGKEPCVVVNDKNEESEKLIHEISDSSSTLKVDSKPDAKVEVKSPDDKNISINSANLIEQMDTDNKKSKSKMNKSTSIVVESKEFNNKRHRTKSWTTISVPPPSDGSFYSDSEVSKKIKKRGSSNLNGSGDGILNSSSRTNNGKDDEKKNTSVITSISSEKKNKRLSEKSVTIDESDQSVNAMLTASNKSIDLEKIITEIKDDPKEHEISIIKNLSGAEKLFKEAPSSVVQTLVYIEDSDSNTGSIGKANTEKPFDGGDQCVPVIEHPLEEKSSKQLNNSCEPMDIDETIPENSSIILLTEKDTSMKPEEQGKEGKRKSSICVPHEDVSINKNSNKSKRKSSFGNSESQNLDKTEVDNKSTLVLSQLKDISANEETVETNSTKNIVDTNEPLSKSLNVNESDKNKKADKKNLSLNYSTSTPLQQKSIKKLGMQINTSIITPNNKNKKEELTNISKNETAMLSQNDSDDDLDSEKDVTDGEESEEEISKEKSKLIDAEAEEASDDYESGDSRDEEERQYEEDNEIKVKGETLDSDDEEEYSDDSDYEKGSFIVSSDDEDNDLLSGSDDDLDMSADELSMSAKSKKKYNERKIKEQKKASREMFQARHKLDESDRSTKPNKSKSKKANPLDSSNSEDDANVEKKTNRRQRIDSSQDISIDVEKSLSKKKKKARRLSDSGCEDNATTEKEMTICEENNVDKMDPLSVQNVIKEEPKTPQKAFEISTVQVTNIEEVEEIQVDENISMMKINETSDPLQATALQYDEEDGDDSDIYSISENEEITQNYDSLLNNLNNTKTKRIKTLDMSLNINKKKKQKTKEPVIDQLNLTQTKSSKKNKNSKAVYCPETKEINASLYKSKNKMDAQNEDSSDSIDMKLLFPEDSNDSGISAKKQIKATEIDENTNEIAEDFIPLKRTDAKTNILEAIDLGEPDKSELNVSNKKNKKPKLSQPKYSTSTGDQDNNDGSFFIDTTGAHIDEVESNVLNKSSAKKNKSDRNSESVANIDEINNTVSNADKAELNMSLQSSGKKNKNKKKAASLINTSEIKDDIVANEANISIENNVDMNKSKNNSVLAIRDDFIDAIAVETEVPVKNSAKKNKDKKKDASIIIAEETKDTKIAASETSIVHSAKKNKKNNKNSSSVNSEDFGDDVIELETSTGTGSKNKKSNDSLVATEVDISIKNSGKKKKKNSISLVDAVEMKQCIDIDEVDANINSSKKNRKNNVSFSIEENKDDAVNDGPVSGSEKKKKRKKKSLDTSKTNIETQKVDEINGVIEKSIDISLVTDGSHKKKKKRSSESQIAERTEEHVIVDEADKSQTRKRKLSANHNVEVKQDDAKGSVTSKSLNESITTGVQKKKRKVSHNNEEVIIQNEDPMTEMQEVITVKKSKKKKNKPTHNIDTDQSNENVLPPSIKDVKLIDDEDRSQSETRKVNKKRKRRDDDDEGKTSKIIKQNSFDKVHVPRLPADILKQLDDKPKQVVQTKKAIISTTSFVVEETRKRRNKPSNYLEESVYLNDASEEKKRKGTIKTPKVLPFIPTASTSDRGFTTNFRINVIQEQPVFAQSADAVNFKYEYLSNKKIKKLGTFEKYKRQRNVKLSKF